MFISPESLLCEVLGKSCRRLLPQVLEVILSLLLTSSSGEPAGPLSALNRTDLSLSYRSRI
ncbi:uncharacterized protein PHALS_02431 [Plasmopara halstedii]|uniref:Uncharacterized protein n=1 Tax=Plasmopara halstedii TaxID=4781 RepID=A0A0P1A7S2_PLAHL|nr:uncharacterized protein PHALS_02431 [Plasmopara halstedii]CEG36341.1 hypothetical protein PHALS_02431 [Plasmopara halstedii]|eukprot:XP_024572710.1 hypothetical protein PHALS_02431 [Plasmopara halstedii]